MLLRMSFVSFIVTFGFGILFNIKGKKLIFAALGGGLSWYCYSLPLSLGLSEVSSLFISALVFSTYSEILARIFKTPVTSFIIWRIMISAFNRISYILQVSYPF